MARLECALADSVLREQAETPLLSIVIPAYNRPEELSLTVASIGDQLTGGLEKRVEMLISDNASDLDTREAILALVARYPTLSYMINARDEGGFFNYFAAPWRARGHYTWVFGSDDVLLEGGVAHVVDLLESQQPSFLTLNKQVANADLSKIVWANANSVPDRRFDKFLDLFCALGVNQLAFISAQIEKTGTARAIDPERYLRTDSRHPHVASYLEKHHNASCYYSSATHLVHRIENSPLLDYHAGNFYDYAVTLPRLLQEIAAEVGAPADMFERITGHKRISDYDPPQVTFVDSIFENILRAMHFGRHMTVGHQRSLEAALVHCRYDRLAQFAEIWKFNQSLVQMERRLKDAEGALGNARKAALATSEMFTRSTHPEP